MSKAKKKKRCGRCKKRLSVNKFRKREILLDGLEYCCRACKSKYDKQWYKTKRSQILKQHTDRYKSNCQQILKQAADYYKNNCQRICKQIATYQQTKAGKATDRKAHKKYSRTEGGKTSHRRYANSDKGKANTIHTGHARRVRLKGANKDVNAASKKQMKQLKDEAIECWVCDKPFNNTIRALTKTLEHALPISIGGDNDLKNLRVTHSICNASRKKIFTKAEIKVLLKKKQI